MNARTKKDRHYISEVDIRSIYALLVDVYYNFFQVKLPQPPKTLEDKFVKSIKTSSEMVITGNASLNKTLTADKVLPYLQAETFSRLAKFFGSELKPRFLTTEQKALFSVIAVFMTSSMMQNHVPAPPSVAIPSINTANSGLRWSIFRKLLGDFSWEIAGQNVSATSLLGTIPYKGGVVFAVSGARATAFFGSVSLGVILLEGLYLETTLSKKEAILKEKTNQLEAFRLGYIHEPRSQGGSNHDVAFEIRYKEIKQECDGVKFDIKELKLRRKYISLCLFVAVIATVLSSVFTAGLLPLAIGVGAMVISLGLAVIEYSEAYYNRLNECKRLEKEQSVEQTTDNDGEEVEQALPEEAVPIEFDLDRDNLDSEELERGGLGSNRI